MSLFDFEEVDPPRLQSSPRRELPVPNPRMFGVAGTVGVLDRDGSLAYVSTRSSTEHRFQKFDGYAISDKILTYLRDGGVETVLIAEEDTGKVYEFSTNDFADHGVAVDEEEDDPQTCVAVEYARRVWDNRANVVL